MNFRNRSILTFAIEIAACRISQLRYQLAKFRNEDMVPEEISEPNRDIVIFQTHAV